MSIFVEYSIVLWCLFMIVFMSIGGFFMFRKFLKQLPKADGNSAMDWERHYMEHTIQMWEQEEKDLLEVLVSPVPEIFSDAVQHSISSNNGDIVLESN